MTRIPDALVVGGGVIGLSVAHALARTGAAVTLLERGRPARGATWAAGGMLAPLGEADDPGPFLSFALTALESWPAWARGVADDGGMDPGFDRCGKLLVADVDGEGALRARHRWQAAGGHDARWLDAAGVGALESGLASGWTAGIHLPDHARVDPRRLGEALARACRACGVDLREGVAARGIEVHGGRVVGVETDEAGTLAAGRVVVAAGAWSGRLHGLPRPLTVHPVRGQMLALAVDAPPVNGLVAGPGAYLIPRDGAEGPLVVIGASMEEAGFDVATDDATIGRLRRAAEALVPDLMGRPEQARWAGLRPATPDDLPVLGVDPDVEGLVYATGHHRNGILLAPATARGIAELVEGRPPDPRWRAFDPARFGEATT